MPYGYVCFVVESASRSLLMQGFEVKTFLESVAVMLKIYSNHSI